MPVPPKPIGDQTKEELDQLEAEVAYLESEKAAVRFEWNSDAFQEWRRPFLAEAAAAGLNRDAFLDTRLMGAAKFSSEDVQAVPVYGGQQQYDQSRQALIQVEDALTIEVMQRLPVPDYDTPLENLIRLRRSGAFRTALDNLLEWKREKAPSIFLQQDRRKAIAAAMSDFDKLTKRYSDAMEAEGHRTMGSVASIFFSILTGELLGALKEGLVSLREVREPCWKKVSELRCAPGAVVYHFEEALR